MNMKNIICLISFILLGIGCQKQNPHNKIINVLSSQQE